jgi:hypothetical protein
MSFTVRSFSFLMHNVTHICCVDDAHAARRRYKKDLDLIKPDFAAYSRQKEIVLGLAPGSLVESGSSTPSASSALTSFDPSGGQVNTAARLLFLLYYLPPRLSDCSNRRTTDGRRKLLPGCQYSIICR